MVGCGWLGVEGVGGVDVVWSGCASLDVGDEYEAISTDSIHIQNLLRRL